jgi:hypothetical protein
MPLDDEERDEILLEVREDVVEMKTDVTYLRKQSEENFHLSQENKDRLNEHEGSMDAMKRTAAAAGTIITALVAGMGLAVEVGIL